MCHSEHEQSQTQTLPAIHGHSPQPLEAAADSILDEAAREMREPGRSPEITDFALAFRSIEHYKLSVLRKHSATLGGYWRVEETTSTLFDEHYDLLEAVGHVVSAIQAKETLAAAGA